MHGEDLLQTVREFVAAIDAHDRAAAFTHMAPELEWHALGLVVSDQPVYQGREAVWAYVESLYEAFEALAIDVEALEAVGLAAVARVRLTGTRPAAGDVVEAQWSSVITFRDGTIARVFNYHDHDEALTDAELKA